MAKNKSYNKIIAGTMTAAMVAGVVTPAAAAGKSFPDVPAGHWAADSINYLVDKGAIKGKPDGTFGPTENIDRASAAVIMASTLGLEVNKDAKPSFEDSKNHWAAPYIAAVEKAGVIKGNGNGAFNPDDQITRASMASMLVNAYKLEAANAETKFDDLKGHWGEKYANILVALEISKGTDNGWAPDKAVSRAETAQFIAKTDAKYGKKEVKEAKVESVKALNGKQVEVTFNQELDKNDAETAGKVSIQGVTFNKQELSEDGKTLTLTAAAAIDVKDATVAVEQIKTKADANVKTEKYVGKMTYKDEVAPKIVSVEAKTNGTVAKEIEIKASEPLKASTGLVKVDGTYATATIDGTDTVKVTGLSLEAGKTHNVELINIEDAAGNKTVSTKVDFTVAVDAAAPTATVTAGESDQQILVTFNKKMDVASVQAALANGSVKDEALADVVTGAVTEVKDSKGTQFIIPVNATLYTTDKNSRTLNVVLKDSIKDTLGNKVTAATQAVTLTKDTVKPVSTGYKIVKEADGKVKAIEVNFSEGLQAAGANAIAFGSVVDANGVRDTDTFNGFQSKAVTAGDKKVVFETTTAKEITGTFAISFAKDLVSDQAQTANKSDAFNYTIDFGQSAKEGQFEIKDDANKPAAAGNVITVTFPEAVKGGAVANSATDLANYSLAGKPLPAGTTITLNGNQTVATITLPTADSIEKDDQAAVFTVANIKNTVGTKALKTYTGTVAVRDNVEPVLQSAKVLDNKTIELTYSENVKLANANVGDSFKIVQGKDTLALADNELTATVASGFDNKLVLKVAKGTDAAATPGTPAVAGSAIVTGNAAAKVTLTNGTAANATETVNYKVVDNAGTLELQNAADNAVVIADLAAAQSVVLNGVTVAITGAADGDTFTVTTTKAVAEVPGTPATSATTLDLTKDITIETLAPVAKDVVDKSAAENQQKKEVKVNVVKP